MPDKAKKQKIREFRVQLEFSQSQLPTYFLAVIIIQRMLQQLRRPGKLKGLEVFHHRCRHG